MAGFQILEEGEEALIYKFDGEVELKKGPKRLWLLFSRLERLQHYNAKQDEYLRICHVNGKVEHKMGPCTVTLNSLKYISISIEKCYCLDANQAIIVYKKEEEKEKEETKLNNRLIITKGPGIFMIQPNEWVHKFCWHGVDDEDKTKYIAEKNRFEVLNFAPSQLYYNVDEVRTSDDALIRIKLMIFYELKDIKTMINETKDPIADILNCCRADIIAFTTKRTYLNFIESCHLLNNSETYSKLLERSKCIGFEITKVIFRGYFASPKLQQMHDSSIQTRTNLKLEFESELQHQEQLMLNLKNNMERLASEQDLEYQKLLNQLEVEKTKLKNDLRIKLADAENQNKLKTELKIKELQLLSEKNELEINHLKNLKELEIDLNVHLVSSISIPNKLVQIIKMSNTEDDKTGKTNSSFANIHLHD